MRAPVRVANASGYWGDDPEALARQVRGGDVDYVTLDFLAEITMVILQRQRARDAKLGYAYDFVSMLAPLLPELAASVERLPFNRPCTGERRFNWAEFSLDEIQAIRANGGGTVNDIILTALTAALARYAREHHQTTARRFVRIVCPVSLRSNGGEEPLGNRISFMPVALPLEARGALARLRGVARRTEVMKRAREAVRGLAA